MEMGKKGWNLLESRLMGNIKASELQLEIPFLISWSCATTASVLKFSPCSDPSPQAIWKSLINVEDNLQAVDSPFK